MRIISAKFQNVFRFGEEDNYINFDNLYKENGGKECIALICGSTDGDENLSNGAGKSSIGEAIYWAFYEKLPRLMRSTDRKGSAVSRIIREADDGTIDPSIRRAYVEIRFETKDKKVWRLMRGRKISKSGKQSSILELECESDKEFLSGKKSGPEKMLAQILGANYESFLSSVFFAQKDSAKFLSGTDNARRDILMDLRGLQIIDRMVKILRDGKKRDCNTICTALEAKMEVLRSRLSNVSLDELRKEKMEHAAEITKKETFVRELEEQITEMAKDPVHTRVQDVSRRLATLEAELEAMRSEKETALTGVNEKIRSCKETLASVSTDATAVKQEKDDLEKEYTSAIAVMKSFSKEGIDSRHAAIVAAQTEADRLIGEIETLREKASGIKIEEAKLEHEASIIDNDIANTKLLLPESGDVGTCPTCNSEWDVESISKKLSEYNENRASISAKIADIKGGKTASSRAFDQAQELLGEARTVLKDEPRLAADIEGLKSSKSDIERCKVSAIKVRDRERDLATRLKAAQQAVSNADALVVTQGDSYNIKITAINRDVEITTKDLNESQEASKELARQSIALKQQVSTASSFAGNLRSEIARVDEKMKMHEKDADDLKGFENELDVEKKTLLRIQYLDKLLSGDAKSEAAEHCIPLLNLYANDFLSVLRGSMRVEIGSDGKGMPIKLIGGSASSYDLLSGGEQEAVRLAVDMGLSMLSIGGISDLPNMIFLDEVFGSLDFTTRENVFALLNRLNKHFDRICVITHDQILQERVAIVVRVDKADGISRILIDSRS